MEMFAYVKTHFPPFNSAQLLDCAWIATTGEILGGSGAQNVVNVSIQMFSLFLTCLLACGEAMLVFSNLTADHDSGHKLTYIEFKVAAARLHMIVSDSILQPIFNEMDNDKSGKITLNEFCLWWSRMKDDVKLKNTTQDHDAVSTSKLGIRSVTSRPLSTSVTSSFSNVGRPPRPQSSVLTHHFGTMPALQPIAAKKKKSPFEVDLVKGFDAIQAKKAAEPMRKVKVAAGGAVSAIKSINAARADESPRDDPIPSIVTLSKQQLLAALPVEAVEAMQRSSTNSELVEPKEPAKFGAALVDWHEKRWADVMAQQDKLQAMWRTLDENGNGLVSGAELDTWFVKRYPKMHVKPVLKQVFLMCRGDDGYIRQPRLGQLLKSVVVCSRAWLMFDKLNIAGAVKQDFKADPKARTYKDKRVEIEEFRVCFRELFPNANDGQCEAEWDLMDADSGGMVLFGEFCVWYTTKAADGFRLVDVSSPTATQNKNSIKCTVEQDLGHDDDGLEFRLDATQNEPPMKFAVADDLSYDDDADFLQPMETSKHPKELSPRSSARAGAQKVLQGVVANISSRSPSASPVSGSRPSSAAAGGAVRGTPGHPASGQSGSNQLSPRSSARAGAQTVLQGVVANISSRSPSSSPVTVSGSRTSSAH
jgi:Ca2+-binding EF-hand superfamily protein